MHLLGEIVLLRSVDSWKNVPVTLVEIATVRERESIKEAKRKKGSLGHMAKPFSSIVKLH